MVNIRTPENTNNNITVSSPNTNNAVNTLNSITFSEDLAQQWAVKLDGKVKNEDYSSKYYAGRANESALNAQSFAQSAQDNYNQVQSAAEQALISIEAKTNEFETITEQAIVNIETKTNDSTNELETITEQNIEEIIIEKNNSITNIQEVSATEQAELEEIKEGIINYAGIYYEDIIDEDIDVDILEQGYVSDIELENALATKQDVGDYVTNTELNNKGYLTSYTETDPVYTADKPNIALKSELPDITPLATKIEVTTGLNSKQDKGDYTTRTELSEGLNTKQDKGNYALKSEIPDISNLATKDELPTQVSALENDSNYATQTQVLQAIASIPRFSLSIVEVLPATGEKMTLYLVPKVGTNNDVYDEYIWIEQTTSFEHLGTTAVDLTDYVKNTDYATDSKAGILTPSSYYATAMSGQYLYTSTKTLDQYKEGENGMFVGKGTLDNVLTQYSKTVPLTQAEYDTLETKDANTLYLIEEE